MKDFLRERDLLLVLDNFEQLVSAAPLVAELLAGSPRLRIVVTSRAVLHVSGEQEFGVPPLDLPDRHNLPPLAALSQYEAVALFIERARAVRPDFEVTNKNELPCGAPPGGRGRRRRGRVAYRWCSLGLLTLLGRAA